MGAVYNVNTNTMTFACVEFLLPPSFQFFPLGIVCACIDKFLASTLGECPPVVRLFCLGIAPGATCWTLRHPFGRDSGLTSRDLLPIMVREKVK